ncbi:UDP-N-acetylglucosamine transferase subunit ALG13 homolog [Geodia barretti]|uniref:UDP-N-acetylglucosamine transferase subunit ALG13 homolog n=1 Tax=Geodia barretti TaxID=519541 RepID=A0AA35TY75_GEOBA|nr:UDP-N-acetylglucosamine transferase subunit ALG13 homolog [Geodia barretti]
MNNHQTELAKKMADEGCCLFTTCSNLLPTLHQFDPEKLTPYKAGDPKLFGHFMDKVMGFSEKSD